MKKIQELSTKRIFPLACGSRFNPYTLQAPLNVHQSARLFLTLNRIYQFNSNHHQMETTVPSQTAAFSTSTPASDFPPDSIASHIRAKLNQTFAPTHLLIIDESHKHAGHASMKTHTSRTGETHFKVTIVSEAFEGVKLIERHRAVNECLKQEIEEGVHALSIDAKTPKQWEAKQASRE
ncbi:hypothetical protein FGO68_gene9541 [Halteria grandinella]|uniref:BolA family transcriptional regulator n=1 Tax=Halteria grandinella TaxID=5974 RepID=A0A8J8NIX2_HALGN|nr:hypothetical protein FGO68_gene9541 [Halteria grandinella]